MTFEQFYEQFIKGNQVLVYNRRTSEVYLTLYDDRDDFGHFTLINHGEDGENLHFKPETQISSIAEETDKLVLYLKDSDYKRVQELAFSICVKPTPNGVLQ